MTDSVGIVDAHLHLWDPVRLPMGWLKDLPILNRVHDPEMYLEDLGSHRGRLQAAVLVEAAVDSIGLERELQWMLELHRGPGPVEALVVGWRPRQELQLTLGWLERLESVEGVVGVREVLHGADENAEAPRDRRLLDSVRAAGARNLVVDLCVRPDQLEGVEWLVGQAPDTRFVLDHLGRPKVGGAIDGRWAEALARLARFDHVDVKLSGLIECAEGGEVSEGTCRPVLEHVLAVFGAERTAWGGNWPVCRPEGSVGGWLDVVDALLEDRPARVRSAVLGGTARRVYGIPTPSD